MSVVVVGCRDVHQHPLILAFCQQSDVWFDERCVDQLAKLLLYLCITCSTPAHRYAIGKSLTCINYVTAPARCSG